MYYRRPHPTEPDVDDARRKLAEKLYADQVAAVQSGDKFAPYVGLLYWLGYRRWMVGGGFTTPDQPSRYRRLMRAFVGKPYYDEIEDVLRSIGYRRPPDRDCEVRIARMEAYVEIEDGVVRWGFKDTPGRDIVFKAFCERVELVVMNGAAHVAKAESTSFDNASTLKELSLTDDDYRFEVSATRDLWWGSRLRSMRFTGQWFDFAEIEGEWIQIENQGRDWDGEWEGSTRKHTAMAAEPETDAGSNKSNKEHEHQNSADKERKAYAFRRANAKMNVVAKAQRYFNGDRMLSSRNYGANWFRTLWALGWRPPTWHGSLNHPEPTSPFTAADARGEEKIWSGWRPFREELERLEKLEQQSSSSS